MIKQLLIVGGILLSLVLSVLGLNATPEVKEEAFAGITHLSGLVVGGDGFSQGGGVLNVVDANGGTYALTQTTLLENNVFEMNAGGAGQAVVALTLPATTTWTTLLPETGDMREWVIDASALSAATTTTVTAGTGIDLLAVTTADDVIDGAEYARLTCWRKENRNIGCITSELLNAD